MQIIGEKIRFCGEYFRELLACAANCCLECLQIFAEKTFADRHNSFFNLPVTAPNLQVVIDDIIYSHTHTHTQIDTFLYIHTYTDTFLYIHTYTHSHTNTHSHTLPPPPPPSHTHTLTLHSTHSYIS